MQSAPTVWITAVTSILAAAISALLTHLYRNRRDRAVVSVRLERFSAFRHPISIPEGIHKNIVTLGGFAKWADDVLKWDVIDNLDRNAFELHELRDLRALCPRYIKKWEERLSDYTSLHKTFSEAVIPTALTPGQKHCLSRIRAFWLESFKQDIFAFFAAEPEEALAQVRSVLAGDIEQADIAVKALRAFQLWLDRGLAPDAPGAVRITPAAKSPSSPQDPYICVEVLARNSGRSETLIKDEATLTVGDLSVPLKGIVGNYGFELYTGKYWRVKPTSIEELRFSQHPRESNLNQLERLRNMIADRRHKGTVELIDYLGNRIVTDAFAIADNTPDA